MADLLQEAYCAAPEGEKVVRITMFGIAYAAAMDPFTTNRVARAAGLPAAYYTELGKGRNLAKYVELKK